MSHIISADAIKKTLPGYNPAHSDLVHSQSAKLADKAFEAALKQRSEQTVILMAGGTASGKTEYISVYLHQRQLIVVDGTLPTFEGAKIKIDKINKANKQAEIHMIVPDSIAVAHLVFLNRKRRFDVSHFYHTHSAMRRTVLKTAKQCPDLPIKIFISKVSLVGSGLNLEFSEPIFPSQADLIAYLTKNQYNQTAIEHIALPLLDDEN